MDFLEKHGEKLVAAFVALVCGYLIFTGLGSSNRESLEAVENAADKIKSHIRSNSVDPEWPYAEEKKVAYSKGLESSFARPRMNAAPRGIDNTFYPRPARPWVNPKLIPDKVPEKPLEEGAVLVGPSSTLARAEHGTIWVACSVPREKMKHFEVVRVEFYRGEEKGKALVKVGDRIPAFAKVIAPPVKPDDDGEKKAVAPEEKPEEKALSGREAKRLAEKEGEGEAKEDEDAAKAGDAAETKGEEKGKKDDGDKLPNDFKSLVVFQDLDVTPKKSYFYKTRIIARLKADAKLIAEERRNGRLIKLTVPAELTSVAAIPGSKGSFYASTFTKEAEAKTPPNFTIRFQSVMGKLPDLVRNPFDKPTYKGSFELRVWIPQFKEYRDFFVYAAVGKPLMVEKKRLRQGEGGKQILFSYDTGLVLAEIVSRKVPTFVRRKVGVTKKVKDADGKITEVPVIDPVTNLQETVMKDVSGIPKITQIAKLRDPKTEKIEEHPKRKSFKRRKATFEYFDRLRKEQEKLRKKKGEAK